MMPSLQRAAYSELSPLLVIYENSANISSKKSCMDALSKTLIACWSFDKGALKAEAF